ncbi:COQ7-domain-containing protein [Patellaria atrata CBS 101060]|uniref:5-demethoxyubiquinone hydroxylase, mitochondrial n=1 Tax=Patellaria atrata CBS 101060 TaxID=1346257 RepID=A0A9P4SCZ5_9PEZI|nr:COQ7-domain-containing protein [Patellaria atrata CBS 101060]
MSTIMNVSKVARCAVRCHNLPVLDFLAPAFITVQSKHIPHRAIKRSCMSTSATKKSNVRESASELPLDTLQITQRNTLTEDQKRFLDSALRVNQAGELAAVLIYAAQTPPIVQSHPHLRPLMKHMYDQEAGHLQIFNELLAKHRIRPTAMYPVWKAAATVLGWSTAVMGREAAMACTEAVETEIGTHYNDQVRVLLEWVQMMEERGDPVGEDIAELVKNLRRIRDEELEHLDHAVENHAKQARPYELLTNIIRGGCRTAIWISERV